VLALALAALAFGAASASAANFQVDDFDDVADATIDGSCDANGADACTLRAAIQEANDETENPGADTITFEADQFNGEAGDLIDIGASDLPAITAPVSISCETAPATTPCARIESAPVNGLTVSSDNVSIHGVAVTNALQGIAVFEDEVGQQLTGFDLEHSWLGITLDNTDGSNGTGLFLDPSVEGAAIGGPVADDRNVFGFNFSVGLRINGADSNTIQGNYFGVLADGVTAAPGQSFHIKLGGADLNPTDNPATDNLIGGLVGAPEQATAACDGPCNVISGASGDGVDLGANGPLGQVAAGLTTIEGNYIGLNADASAAIANSGAGVDVGGADDVNVGTSGPAGANRINGGTAGVSASDGASFSVRSNRIGVNFAETATLAAPQVGVDFANPDADLASVNLNRIATSTGDGIRMSGGNGVEIDQNLVGIGAGGQELGVGGSGIHIVFATEPELEGNTVVGANLDGLRIEDTEGALVDGQNAFGLLGLGNDGAGVRISNVAQGTVLGSDNPARFNDISGNLGGAIVIEGSGTDDNQVLGNTGAGNGGLFIDLGDDGAGATTGANNDIQTPLIAAVTTTTTSGVATPGATVRLYEKSSSDQGEIADLLGTDVADGDGDWEVTYGTTPAFVGATQTVAGDGTSELAVAAFGTDTIAPETTLTKKPKKKSTKRKAKFKFESSEDGSTFECKLDKKPFKPCTSPFKKKVKPKKHKFKVRAIDAAGNVDPTPAKAKFKVLKPE
jgi:CSLREA domain-containing protein